MIAIASDHAGYALKESIKQYLSGLSIPYRDFGTNTTESCDYPLFADNVCNSILQRECSQGILVCGTGIGMSMAANRHRGIRAAVCTDEYCAKYTRLHNDANVLCLGARVVGEGLAQEIVQIFLSTPFEGGKHQKRIDLFR